MDCAGCGDCCDPVWLEMTPLEVAALSARLAAGRRIGTEPAEANVRFIAAHMVPVDPQPAEYADGSPAAGYTAWRCDSFDPASRLCTAHDDRPPICRGYPWYGDDPRHDTTVLPDGCSHRWDLEDDRGELAGRLLPLWPK